MFDRIIRNVLFVGLVFFIYGIVSTSPVISEIEGSIYPFISHVPNLNLSSTTNVFNELYTIIALILILKLFVVLCTYSRNEVLNFIALIVFAGTIYFSNFMRLPLDIRLPFTHSIVMLLIFYSFLIVYKTSYLNKEKQYVKKLFSRYVNPELLKTLVKDPDSFAATGEHRELTIMFSDIRGFTSLSEKLRSKDVFIILNKYLEKMTKVIKKRRGTIDKFIGDAIMAFWNAPLNDVNHQVNSIKAGLDMIVALDEFNQENNTNFKIGIGMHTGVVLVGNVGGNERFDYTAIGDPVNLASRIEGLTKKYGVNILVTEAVVRGIPTESGLIFRIIDNVIVKGKTHPIKIFQPFADTSDNKVFTSRYEEGFNAYVAGDFNKATFIFQHLHNDGPSHVMLSRIKQIPNLHMLKGIWKWDEK